MMNFLVNTPPNNLDALKRVEERSIALLVDMDRFESLIDPVARLKIALDRLALQVIGKAVRDLESLDLLLVRQQSTVEELSAFQADEAGDPILKATQILQDSLQALHKQIGIVKVGSTNPDVLELCSFVLLVIRRMFDTTEKMRWAVMELQADADLAASRVNKFSSAADLLQHLHRAAN